MEGKKNLLNHNLSVTSLDGTGASAVSPAALDSTPGISTQVIPPDVLPPMGSAEEEAAFRKLYDTLPEVWKRLDQCNGQLDEYVVVVPSMSLDPDELRKVGGIEFYEERLLFLLIMLSNPRTHVVFVTSVPIRDRIIDYYLQLLPGIPYAHSRRRLHLFSTEDSSRDKCLTEKILERPALLRRIKNCIKGAEIAHLSVFNCTQWEKRLSVALNLPLMGADPQHLHFGTKSGARKLFRQAGILFPDGSEDLKSANDIAEAIASLYERKPQLRKAVVKLNDGFSGEGNGIYQLAPLKEYAARPGYRHDEAVRVILDTLPTHCKLMAPNLTWDSFVGKFPTMEGIVEEFLEGVQKESPSVQTRLTPMGEVQIISTHDQIMGGEDGQVFLGCRFPAAPPFHEALHQGGLAVGQALTKYGLVERVSLDYLAVPSDPTKPVSLMNQWKLYAIEINMRKGGTTHPFRTLQFLTGGRYYPDTGLFMTPSGVPKYYVASDNLKSPDYKGLLPEDIIEITTFNNLHYNSTTNTGVVFHVIGATSQYGKLGLTCVGDTPQQAQELHDRAVAVLNQECHSTRWLIK